MDIYSLIALIIIESTGNPLAFNQNEFAVGCMQIRPMVIADYNHYNKAKLQPREMFDVQTSVEVVMWYTEHYGTNKTLIEKIRIWNGGPNGYMKESTLSYKNKYERIYNAVKKKDSKILYSMYNKLQKGEKLSPRDLMILGVN